MATAAEISPDPGYPRPDKTGSDPGVNLHSSFFLSKLPLYVMKRRCRREATGPSRSDGRSLSWRRLGKPTPGLGRLFLDLAGRFYDKTDEKTTEKSKTGRPKKGQHGAA